MRGDDAYRLWLAAADAAQEAGDAGRAARDLATATTTYYRMSGVFARLPAPAEPNAILARANELAGQDPAARAAVVLAECGALGDAFFADEGEPKAAAAETLALAERAVELARRVGDPLAECAALDALTGAQHRAGDTFGAAASARRRVDLVRDVPVTPASAAETIDVLVMASETSIGVGDLIAARQWGRQLRDLPLLAEVGHFATSRLLMAEALAGRGAEVIQDSRRFLDGWTRAGRPHAPSFGPAAAAVAMIHGLRGDDAAQSGWLAIIDDLGVPAQRRSGYSPTFDAVTLLHRGQAALALERLSPQDGALSKWLSWIWLHWHLALRAEAGVLAGHPEAARYVSAARPQVAGNPIATALVERADAMLEGDQERLLATATALETAGCLYQQARTFILAGGHSAATGNALLASLDLTPAAATG
jgi:hypothetical protein